MNIEAFVWIFVCSQNNSKWIFSLLALYSTHALYSLLPPLYPPTFYHSITSVFLHPLFLLLHTPTQWSFISFFSFLFLLLRFCSISSSLLYFLLFCFSLFYNYRIDRVASSDKNRNRVIEITSLFSSSIFDVLLIPFLSSTDVINLPQFEEVITKAITKTKTKTADCRPPLPFATPLELFYFSKEFYFVLQNKLNENNAKWKKSSKNKKMNRK